MDDHVTFPVFSTGLEYAASLLWAVLEYGDRLKPVSYRVLAELITRIHWTDRGHYVSGETWPSTSTLAESVGITRQSVSVALSQLEELGLIERIKRPGRSNLLRVALPPPIEEARMGRQRVQTRCQQTPTGCQQTPTGGVNKRRQGVSTNADIEPIGYEPIGNEPFSLASNDALPPADAGGREPGHEDGKDMKGGKNTRKKPAYTHEFETFWAAYPTRNGLKKTKAASFMKWKQLKRDGVLPSLDVLLKDLERHKAVHEWRDGFPPDCVRYLRGKGWEDDIEIEGSGLSKPGDPHVDITVSTGKVITVTRRPGGALTIKDWEGLTSAEKSEAINAADKFFQEKYGSQS